VCGPIFLGAGQAGIIWNELFGRWNIRIHFAHRTFVWESETRGKAHVHCVIIGFGGFDCGGKLVFDYETGTGDASVTTAKNISPYLIEGPNLALPNISKPVCRVPEMGIGNKPIDEGHYLFSDATPFHFGILSSTMHMGWMRQVAGRLKSDYRYSAGLVYNNFPRPTDASDVQRLQVEACAQAVLSARDQFPGSTLADLYDPLTMPPVLAKAHADLDRAVDRCYRKEPFQTDRQRVEYLFALYEQLAAPLVRTTKKPGSTGRVE
jgi:hypothetical protein